MHGLIVAASVLVAVLPAQRAACELTPAQCVVLYNSDSKVSVDLAKYYARVRGIPTDHLLGLSLPLSESLTRSRYDKGVRPGVRDFLSHHSWGADIRCLVTCYDIPLRVGAFRPDEATLRRIDALEQLLAETVVAFDALIEEIERSGRPRSKAPSPGRVQTPAKRNVSRSQIESVYDHYQRERVTLTRLYQGLTGDDARRAGKTTLGFIARAEGVGSLLLSAQKNSSRLAPKSIPRLRSAAEAVSKTSHEIDRLIAAGSSAAEFDAAIPLIRDASGLYGVSKAVFQRIDALRVTDSHAAFDSELAMVLVDDYPLRLWCQNGLYAYAPADQKSLAGRTLMVGRIDGPTPEVARRMIDQAIETEARGLRGTFYIDARGLTREEGYVTYDHDMIDLAKIVRTRTKMSVVLDQRSAVFSPGSCPQAALYCGWYSLAQYVDAFDFVEGAVAAHLASFELVSLRDASKAYWCKELLADGAAATFGPTAEPYLESFPMPTRFFGSLLTGQYTLVEAFYRSKPANSWQHSILGDPLYNPFKNNPQLPIDWEKRD